MIYFTSFDDKIGFAFYIMRNSFIFQNLLKLLILNKLLALLVLFIIWVNFTKG